MQKDKRKANYLTTYLIFLFEFIFHKWMMLVVIGMMRMMMTITVLRGRIYSPLLIHIVGRQISGVHSHILPPWDRTFYFVSDRLYAQCYLTNDLWNNSVSNSYFTIRVQLLFFQCHHIVPFLCVLREQYEEQTQFDRLAQHAFLINKPSLYTTNI